jgi:hypothetical protein
MSAAWACRARAKAEHARTGAVIINERLSIIVI